MCPHRSHDVSSHFIAGVGPDFSPRVNVVLPETEAEKRNEQPANEVKSSPEPASPK